MPFLLCYGRHPKLPGGLKPPESNFPAVPDVFVKNVAQVVKQAKEKLEMMRHRAKQYANEKRRPVQYKVGDLVLLSTRNIQLKTPGVNKLLPKYLGPFPVTEVLGPVAYRIELPPVMKCHNVFHASLLLKYRSNGNIQPPPLPLEFDDGEGGDWFVVEAVLDMRTVSRGRGRAVKQYLVKWQGYGDEHNMWCDEDGVTESAVQAFLQRQTGQQNTTATAAVPDAAAGVTPNAVVNARPSRASTDYTRGRHASRGRGRRRVRFICRND